MRYTVIHDGLIMNGVKKASAEEAEEDGALIFSFDRNNEIYKHSFDEKTQEHIGKVVGVDGSNNEIYPFLEKNNEHLKEARENGLLILKVIKGAAADIYA